MTIDDYPSYLVDTMDKLWFHQNILYFEPTAISIQSMLNKARRDSATQPNLPSSTISESSGRFKSDDENKNRQSLYKEKRPAKLNIVIRQPLFQLQTPQRSKIHAHASSPAINSGIQPKIRRVSETARSYRSLSELENYELKGFIDLGFVFPTEKLSPEMMSMVPGLQRLSIDKGKDNGDMGEEKIVSRPYLSEAWLIDRPDSPLLNLHMLPKSLDGDDMKKHLRFWARKVASLVQES